jgi:hypothetical protein
MTATATTATKANNQPQQRSTTKHIPSYAAPAGATTVGGGATDTQLPEKT